MKKKELEIIEPLTLPIEEDYLSRSLTYPEVKALQNWFKKNRILLLREPLREEPLKPLKKGPKPH